MPAGADSTPETVAISPDGTRAIISVIDEAMAVMLAEGLDGIVR